MHLSSFSVLPYLWLLRWAVFVALPLACAMPLAAQAIITKTLDRGSNGNTGQYTSQAIVNGNPAAAYYNVTDSSLMYAHNSAVDGSGSWSVITVDSAGVVGFYPSLGVVNGNPAISYYDSTNGDLKYVRAADASGTTWGTPVTIDSPGNVGSYTSLVVVNGNPAISYYDGTNVRLKYVRATDASGTSWGTPVTLDGTGNVGQYTSLAVVNGNPAISYLDLTNFDLKFVRAADPMGTSWGTPVTLDSAGNVGFHISQAVVNGNPAISYYDATNQDLKYVRALDASGTSWGLPVTLDSTGSVGQSTSLAVVNGNPAISYNDVTNGDLKYMRALDASGTSWGAPVTLDGPSSVGQYTSLAVVNGNPAISYYDVTNQDLKYVRATDASGTSWSAGVTADSGSQSGAVGQYTSQAVVNGNPAICYLDVTNGDLKYMRATDVGGTSWGLPVTLDSTGSVGQYTSLAVVNGNPAISYYDVTNQDLKYVRALDASGTSWGLPVTLDSTGSVGQYTSLAVVNGNPAISYYDVTNGDLKYMRALDASGTSWGAPVTLDGAIVGGQYTSLAVVNGNPAISYYDNTNTALKYVRATDSSGTNWGTPVTLDSANVVGWDTSLAVVNGNPAISYYDNTNGDLKYVRATDASGTNWGTPVALDSFGDVGQYTSLAVVNGNPAISYYDNSNQDLKYVRATDASGTSWGAPVTFDSNENVGQYSSLAVVNGNPAISYYYATEFNLKWATMILVSPPTVTSVSPSSGGVGTSITITGTGFTGATSVTIGGTAATSFNVVNDTTITAVTPAGNVGSASVLVTTPGGTNAANTAFTYLASNTAPTITSNGGGATAAINVPENTTAVTTVAATDTDLPAQTITYSKSGAAAALFNIDSGTGALTFAAAPDFENNAGPFSVTVTATDNGMPSALSDSQDLTITVTNVNEMPSFTVGANQTHNFGTNTAQTIANWATSIDNGDSTVTQTLTFNVVGNSNPGIFTTPPSIDANGTLTYRPNGTAGMAIINVRLTDDNSINGTAALNSFLESFVITVNTPPDINITGNNQIIVTGDTTPSTSDGTDFGDGFPGIPVSKLFTIQNVGNGPLVFTGTPIISISGPHASEFTVSAQPAASLSSFATSFFNIDFLPADAGLRTATVTVASNDPDEASFTFAIQGNGLAANIVVEGNSTTITKGDTTPSLTDHTDFGPVTAVGAVTAVRTFTIRNNGNRDLTGIFATTDGSLSDFTITTTPVSTLAPAGTTTLGVTFNPTTRGLRSLTLQIYSSDRNDSPFEFTIAGTGANSAPTDIALTAASLAENNAALAPVGTLSTTDADPGDASTATYSLVTGSGDTENASFSVSGNTLRLNTSANFESQSSYAIRLQVNDGQGGTYSEAFTITITDVNEMPSFIKGGNQSPAPDSGFAHSITGWATGVDDGDSTVAQSLSFTVTEAGSSGMFAAAPAVSSSGTLSYTFNGLSAGGTATFDVTLMDDASINGTAALTTAPQSFTITWDKSKVIVDDGGAGYTDSGLTISTTPGRLGDQRELPSTAAGQSSTWTFTGLTPNSRYKVSTTWVPVAGATAAAPFRVYQGSIAPLNLLGTTTINQTAAPDDFDAYGVPWEDFGHVYNCGASGTLVVQLNQPAAGIALADSVQVEPLAGPEVQVTDSGAAGANVPNTSTTVVGSSAVAAPSVRDFIIWNLGTTSLTLGTVSITGTHASDFQVTSSPGSSLAVNGTTPLQITFIPSALGVRSATVSFSSNDPDENPFSFTVSGAGLVPGPLVTSVFPASGTITGGTSITISGSNFTGATGVTVGGIAATNVVVVNSDSITCNTPPGTAGPASVLITTPAGTNAPNYSFIYVGPSAVTPVVLGSGGTTGTGTGTGEINAPNATASGSLGRWESIRQGAVISSNGSLAFRGHLELGTGTPPVTVNDFQGIWKNDGTDTRLKARSGSGAPESDSSLFDILPLNPSISPDGFISFYGTLRLGSGTPAVTASTNQGLWSEIGGGSVRLLLREGDVIVGSKTFRSGFAVTTSTANTAALNAKLSGGSALIHLDVNSSSVQLTVVAEEGQSAPGGGTWAALDGNSSDPRLSADGALGFIGWEKVGNSLIQGIYSRVNTTPVGTSGTVVQARVGGTAPGTSGATFSAFERPTVFNGGMAFRGFLNVNGDNAAGNKGQGVWAGALGALAPVVRTGDTSAQIPTIPAGRSVTSVWSPFSNTTGSITMRVGLSNGGGETRAIVGSTGGVMRVIAKVGDTAPGLPGETFTNFDHPVIGDGDQVAFTAATNAGSYGIWKEAPSGGAPSLIIKAGDTISTSQGDKVVSTITLPGTTTDDRKYELRCMDAGGRLLIHVSFTDGTSSLLLGQ